MEGRKIWDLRTVAECIEKTGKPPVSVRWVDANDDTWSIPKQEHEWDNWEEKARLHLHHCVLFIHVDHTEIDTSPRVKCWEPLCSLQFDCHIVHIVLNHGNKGYLKPRAHVILWLALNSDRAFGHFIIDPFFLVTVFASYVHPVAQIYWIIMLVACRLLSHVPIHEDILILCL